MTSLPERLSKGEILVADGAMGSLLFQKGLKAGECPEALNTSKPDILEEIAKLYLEAGSDIVQTNTFGGSPMKLAQYGLDDRTEELNRAAVRCVRNSVSDRALISGSCGPSGRLLKPYGDAEPEDLYHGFRRQIKALIESGVDVICIETMTDATEAAIAVRAAKSISPDTPVMATMTFDKTPKGFFTIMGLSIPAAAERLAKEGADILGSNCGSGITDMIGIAQEFRIATKLPLLIQANAGLPELVGGKLQYPETPEFFAEKALDLIKAGVSIVGGCCGTTPEHIRAIRKAVDSIEAETPS